MKTKVIQIIALFILLPFSSLAEDKAVVKISAIIPLSGDMAMHCVKIQRALRSALEEFNQEQSYYTYQLIFEDNQLMA